jgi:TPP-dependent pyruvate/acetoin dehydrogenase alpha subunit
MTTRSKADSEVTLSESAPSESPDSESPTQSARDPELLARIHATMVLTRAVEDRMVAMYKGGDLLGSLYTGHWHEGISVGAASALRQDDYLAPIHRDLGAHLWRGMEPWQVMASFMGKATSPTGGRDGTLHYGRLDLNIYNLPSHIPANYPVAVGMGFAAQYRGQDRVSLAFCGDGSTSRADWHESLNIAGVLKLPCVFVVENNQFAYSTPLSLQTASESFAVKAVAYGMPGVKVDGTDVLAVHDATAEAVTRARAGLGPSLIEAVTMRMHGHAEHDSADYVPREMLAEWEKKDPVELFEQYLVTEGILDADRVAEVRKDARQQAIDARKKAMSDPMPDPATVEVGVYAD